MEKVVALILTGPEFSIFDSDTGLVFNAGEQKILNGSGGVISREWYSSIEEAKRGLLHTLFTIHQK